MPLVAVLPVFQGVRHRVARLPVGPEGLEEPAHALGRGQVQVEASLLVADAIGKGPRAQGHACALQGRQRHGQRGARRHAVEDEAARAIHRGDRRLARQLEQGLVHGGLGEMRGEPLRLERVGGGRLEPHRERELERHDDEERQREQDGEQREAALARHGATVRMGITSGRASVGRPPRDSVTVTSTAAGSSPSSRPLQRSCHV